MDPERKCGMIFLSLCILVFVRLVTSASFDSWTPLGPENSLEHSLPPFDDACTLYKINLTQHGYFQYVQYKAKFPHLLGITVCLWQKFENHSLDHPLFSYAVPDQPRAVLAWISQTDRSSYYNMAIAGHTLYTINYPLRVKRWYHSCQSWNSESGEWMIYVNGERVGKGFAPELIGYVIPGAGIPITGQEQRQYGGDFKDGMIGEVTLLNVFAASLGRHAAREVKQVMQSCSADGHPYPQTSIISWNYTPKKLYSGVLYMPARSVCGHF